MFELRQVLPCPLNLEPQTYLNKANKKLTKDVRSSAFAFWVLSRNLLELLPLLATNKGKSITDSLMSTNVTDLISVPSAPHLCICGRVSYSIKHIIQG